jgi:EAL domain-containing protein (putative c-di-GMP-specific phosphodiesterase class I)
VFSDTPAPLRDRLSALREMGIQVCIDDFGTGYSSLGRLHHLPVDKLKIDRMFVRHLEQAPGNAEIIRTILALAGNLGLDVVAEGVETDHQLQRLKGMACRYGQGFLFSRPVPSERVDEVLSHRGNGTTA